MSNLHKILQRINYIIADNKLAKIWKKTANVSYSSTIHTNTKKNGKNSYSKSVL